MEMIFWETITAYTNDSKDWCCLQNWTLDVVYKKWTEMYIADTLSRAYLQSTTPEEIQEEMELSERELLWPEPYQLDPLGPPHRSRHESISWGD